MALSWDVALIVERKDFAIGVYWLLSAEKHLAFVFALTISFDSHQAYACLCM